MTTDVSAVLTAFALGLTTLLPLGPPGTAPADPALPASARSLAAVWPLDPRPGVLARFDPPERTWSAGHRGVDLAGVPGQPVRAALAGRVGFAGTIAGRGVVVVDHGDRRTTYEPVVAAVHLGQAVAAGEPLGTLQGGPGHCFPATCLHWGLIAREVYQDPLGLLPGPVRLLPLSGASGPGVGQLVGAPQPLAGDVGVDLRGRQ